MLKKIGLGVLAVLALFLAFVATRPAAVHIERSTVIAATPDIVFPLINDFHGWKRWSPWEERDPKQTTTYDGPAMGVGAKTGWSGNDDVGEGRMTIEESRGVAYAKIKLEFIRPFENTAMVDFTLTAEGTGTKVTWGYDGTNGFMAKAFGIFVNMDKMLGGDFEKGLASMKSAAEADAAKRAEEAKRAAEAAAAAAAGAAVPADPNSPATPPMLDPTSPAGVAAAAAAAAAAKPAMAETK